MWREESAHGAGCMTGKERQRLKYRFFFPDDYDKVLRRPDLLRLDDDTTAIRDTRDLQDHSFCEFWKGAHGLCSVSQVQNFRGLAIFDHSAHESRQH